MTEEFKQGHAAAYGGVSALNNPYMDVETYPDDQQFDDWLDGWTAGRQEQRNK